MIKTVLNVYKITHEFTRNEVKRLIAKRHPYEWGNILFDEMISFERVRHETPCAHQFELSADCPTHNVFNHEFSLKTTPTGTVIVRVWLAYVQVVEVATDNPKWIAYRNVLFDSHLTDSEKDLLQKI